MGKPVALIRILISWHTDDIDREQYNLELSINRAKSIYNWLINNGIESGRLEFTGFGKSRPLFKDIDKKFRALNRRVEVKVIDNISLKRQVDEGDLSD